MHQCFVSNVILLHSINIIEMHLFGHTALVRGGCLCHLILLDFVACWHQTSDMMMMALGFVDFVNE